jgi:hypothetical protein
MRRVTPVGALLGLLGANQVYRLLARGALTLDTGIGRRVRPLGPAAFTIAAPREVVFDVIAAPYLGRTPRALEHELEVWERGSDMVLAAHFTAVKCGVTATLETVRFTRPERIDFRLVRGPVPHVVESIWSTPSSTAARASPGRASWAPTSGRPAPGGVNASAANGRRRSDARSPRSPLKPNAAQAESAADPCRAIEVAAGRGCCVGGSASRRAGRARGQGGYLL